jgi:hypothetical protein
VSAGYIETDDTIGSITESNITDYQIAVTGGEYPYTFSPADNPATSSVSVRWGLYASPQSLILPWGGPLANLSNAFHVSHLGVADGLSPRPRHLLSFRTEPEASSSDISEHHVYFEAGLLDWSGEGLYGVFGSGLSVTISGPDLVLATVPEPSAVTLTLLGMFVGVFAITGRSRSHRKTKATGSR